MIYLIFLEQFMTVDLVLMKLLLNEVNSGRRFVMIGFYANVALVYLYYRKIITREQMYNMFVLFSSKADNYGYDSKAIDTNPSRFNGKNMSLNIYLTVLTPMMILQTNKNKWFLIDLMMILRYSKR
jgi:hypothetical protein